MLLSFKKDSLISKKFLMLKDENYPNWTNILRLQCKEIHKKLTFDKCGIIFDKNYLLSLS